MRYVLKTYPYKDSVEFDDENVALIALKLSTNYSILTDTFNDVQWYLVNGDVEVAISKGEQLMLAIRCVGEKTLKYILTKE